MKIYCFVIGLGIAVLTGCTPGEYKAGSGSFSSPATKLILNIRADTVGPDTTGIVTEIKGLLRLTDENPRVGSKDYKIESSVKDSLLTLIISPQITRSHQWNLEQILDTLTKDPSALPAFDTKIKITETDPELLELLNLESGREYILQPDLSRANWVYEKQETPSSVGSLSSVYATTYLSYKLKQAAPSLNYTYQLDKDSNSKTAESIAGIFEAMGPIEVSYTLISDPPDASRLWDSLRVNHRLQIDPDHIQLAWKGIDFGYRYTSPILAADTLIEASIDKLMTNTEPYLFHLLMAPALSRTMTDYQFGETNQK